MSKGGPSKIKIAVGLFTQEFLALRAKQLKSAGEGKKSFVTQIGGRQKDSGFALGKDSKSLKMSASLGSE